MKLVFLLEEQSMKYFLDGLLPRILPEEIQFVTIPHEGKSDLQKSLTAKLQGWNGPDVRFVVVQDQDSNDCRELKEKLLELCIYITGAIQKNLTTHSSTPKRPTRTKQSHQT